MLVHSDRALHGTERLLHATEGCRRHSSALVSTGARSVLKADQCTCCALAEMHRHCSAHDAWNSCQNTCGDVVGPTWCTERQVLLGFELVTAPRTAQKLSLPTAGHTIADA